MPPCTIPWGSRSTPRTSSIVYRTLPMCSVPSTRGALWTVQATLLLLLSRSVVSDSVRPHGRQPTRLPRPCDSPGKSTGVGAIASSTRDTIKSHLAISDSSHASNPYFHLSTRNLTFNIAQAPETQHTPKRIDQLPPEPAPASSVSPTSDLASSSSGGL